MLYVICVTYFSGKKLIDQNNRLEWSVELVMELVWVPLRFLFVIKSTIWFFLYINWFHHSGQHSVSSPSL